MVGKIRVEIKCKSRIGCQRLARAVILAYQKDKKRKQSVIEKLQKSIDSNEFAGVILEQKRKKLDLLIYEFDVFCRFEKSDLYDLYFSLLEEPEKTNTYGVLQEVKMK